jgi:hypothetical protein
MNDAIFFSFFSIFLFPMLQAQKVGVDDDYYLDFPVSFSCPWRTPNISKASDDDGDDDYYGNSVPAQYPGFVFYYVWMFFITAGPLLFFLVNNKLYPIGESKPFVPECKFSETFINF